MVILGSGISIWIVCAALAGGLGLMAYSYRRLWTMVDFGPRMPRVLMALRAFAVLMLVLLLANPILRVNSAPRDSQQIAVVLDVSKSMAVHDSIGGESRLQTARRILNDQGVLGQLGQLATIKLMGFDAQLRPLDNLNAEAAGDGSDLGATLAALRDRKQTAPLVAVVVLTDGCETGAQSAADVNVGLPVYTVGLGSLHEALTQFPDVAMTDLKADHEAFVHTQIEVKVELRETQLAGEFVTLQLLRGEQVLAEQSVELKKDTTLASLHFTPDTAGLYDLEARAVPLRKEKITENNSRFFAVRVSGQKIRVFYYEGTPRWTYKFMVRELKRDPQIALQALLRTNVDALYRATTGPEVSGALFPASKEALKGYDCVILGDLRASDLSAAQAEAVKGYVEDGGGLILLAGRDAYSAAGLPMLGLDVLMPASLASAKELTGAFNVSITHEGAAHPALGGIDKLLPVQSVFTLGDPRPGAQVLARAEGEKGSYALALAQRYGNGRVFCFASDSDWNWPMKYKSSDGDVLFGRFWGQVIRWASNRQLPKEEAGALALTTDKDVYKLGETVHVYASGTQLDGLTEVTVSLPLPVGTAPAAPKTQSAQTAKSVTVPNAATSGAVKVPFNKSGERLEARYAAMQPGIHHLAANGANGEFLVERPAGEFDRIALNDTLLRQLAAASGGQYFDAITARQLPETIKLSGNVKTEIREYVFNDSWLPLILLVAALSGEWALRKKMQMI